MLEERLNEWVKKVLKAYESSNSYVYANTYQMIVDVDEILAEEFDHEPIFEKTC